MSPRDEDDVTLLVVEWKVFDVQDAGRLDQRREEPKYCPVIRHDRVGQHVVVELVASAATNQFKLDVANQMFPKTNKTTCIGYSQYVCRLVANERLPATNQQYFLSN